MIYWMMANG